MSRLTRCPKCGGVLPHSECFQLATLTKDIDTRAHIPWRKGETVRARRSSGPYQYLIERLEWKGSKDQLLNNQCVGVPRSALKFHEQ